MAVLAAVVLMVALLVPAVLVFAISMAARMQTSSQLQPEGLNITGGTIAIEGMLVAIVAIVAISLQAEDFPRKFVLPVGLLYLIFLLAMFAAGAACFVDNWGGPKEDGENEMKNGPGRDVVIYLGFVGAGIGLLLCIILGIITLGASKDKYGKKKKKKKKKKREIEGEAAGDIPIALPVRESLLEKLARTPA